MTNFLQAQPLAPSYARQWAVLLARQQAIYEELLASHELDAPAGMSVRTGADAGADVPVSVRELTRELSGWSLQWAA